MTRDSRLLAEAFTAAGGAVTWADVVAYARASGAWAAVETETAEGAACLAADREAGRAPSSDAVKAAAAEWRTRRRLTAAEDMEAWLDRRGLDVPGFFDHIRRTLARVGHDDAPDLTAREPASDDEQRARQTWTTAVCSGALDRAAHDLAGRLAVQRHLVDDGDAAAGDDDLDEVMERFRTRVVTPVALQDELRARQLDWIRLDADVLMFPTRQAAAEARLCLLDDGSSPTELATATGAPMRRQHQYVEEAPMDDQPALLAAQRGDVVGPLVHRPGWRILAVAGRLLPSLDDPDVRRRAEQVVLSRAVSREVDERVIWRDP